MAKAAQVLAALKRDGWVQVRQRGSHRRLVKGPSGVRGPFTTAWTWALCSSRKSQGSSAMRNWSFRVPSLGIVGGAETREEAERRVVDAVAFTLEGEEDGSAPAQTEVRYLNVEIAAG